MDTLEHMSIHPGAVNVLSNASNEIYFICFPELLK
eukprot:SAG22_NODE_57_length_23647_cov_11.746688_1_plen_35_part_00